MDLVCPNVFHHLPTLMWFKTSMTFFPVEHKIYFKKCLCSFIHKLIMVGYNIIQKKVRQKFCKILEFSLLSELSL